MLILELKCQIWIQSCGLIFRLFVKVNGSVDWVFVRGVGDEVGEGVELEVGIIVYL